MLTLDVLCLYEQHLLSKVNAPNEGQGHAVADITRQHNVSEARPLSFERACARGASGQDQAFLHGEDDYTWEEGK